MGHAQAINRADRRRQAKEDEKRVARGLDARLAPQGQIVALIRALDQKLKTSIQRRSVSPLMEFVYSSMSGGARLIRDAPIACGRGCSHCCHSWVDAGPAEVLFAVKSLPAGQRARVSEAVEHMCVRTGGKPFEKRAAMVTPCPLLVDHACSVYSSRPIVCRSAVSADAGACRRSYLEASGESIPVPTVWRTLGTGYAVALEAALIHSGLAAKAREWNESLRRALGDPGAEARWLAGEDVFAGLPAASEASTFEAPSWAALYREAFGSVPPGSA